MSVEDYQEALLPLLLVQAFIYGPLTLLMPGQVEPTIPLQVKETIAYGDLASGITALLAAILVRFRMKGGRPMQWPGSFPFLK